MFNLMASNSKKKLILFSTLLEIEIETKTKNASFATFTYIIIPSNYKVY